MDGVRMGRICVVAVGVLAAFLALGLPAHAAPPGPASCTIAPATLAFGMYSDLTPTPLDATANLGVTCTSATTVLITMSPGGSGSAAARQMSSATSTGLLSYNIYSDKKFSAVWDDGAGALSANSNKAVTVYGRIPAGQLVPAGLYSDALLMTISP